MRNEPARTPARREFMMMVGYLLECFDVIGVDRGLMAVRVAPPRVHPRRKLWHYRRDPGGLAAELALRLGLYGLARLLGRLALDGDAATEGEAVDDDVRAARPALAGRARVVEGAHQAEAVDLDMGIFRDGDLD